VPFANSDRRHSYLLQRLGAKSEPESGRLKAPDSLSFLAEFWAHCSIAKHAEEYHHGMRFLLDCWSEPTQTLALAAAYCPWALITTAGVSRTDLAPRPSTRLPVFRHRLNFSGPPLPKKSLPCRKNILLCFLVSNCGLHRQRRCLFQDISQRRSLILTPSAMDPHLN
jgi:hypothetical protein